MTISSLCIAAILVIGLIENIAGRKTFSLTQLLFYIAFLGLIAFSVLVSNLVDVYSILLYVFYLTAFLFSGYKIPKEVFYKKLRIILIVYTIFSIYGIYQFAAYAIDLPFKEFIIEGHMVVGFNRTNLVEIGGYIFQRAHSIYLEPSTLSQFAAFAVLLCVILYVKKYVSLKMCISFIFINIIAALLSVAGTGYLMLFILILYFFLRYFIQHGINIKFMIGLGFLSFCVLLVFILDMPLTNYIRIRLSEIFDPKFSGGMRFSYPYLIMFDIWNSFFFGCSPGNEVLAINHYFEKINMPPTFSTMASGYAKIGVELGFFGLLLLTGLLFSLNKKDTANKYIFVFVLCINFVGGNLLQSYFWVFVMLLNVDFYRLERNAIKRISYC